MLKLREEEEIGWLTLVDGSNELFEGGMTAAGLKSWRKAERDRLIAARESLAPRRSSACANASTPIAGARFQASLPRRSPSVGRSGGNTTRDASHRSCESAAQ